MGMRNRLLGPSVIIAAVLGSVAYVNRDALFDVVESALTQAGDPVGVEAVSELAASEAVPVVDEAPVDDEGLEPLALWRAARSAAWQGDTALAIKRYRALIARQPNNPDAYGELGNLYVQQGQWPSAVDLYYKAALLLDAAGQPMMAGRLQRIMRGFDHKKADDLYRKLMHTGE